MTTRNQVFDVLIALAPPTVGGQQIKSRSRKFKHFDKVAPDQQPALFQTEPSENSAKVTGMPYKRRWYASWTVYFHSNPDNDNDVPAIAMNDYMDGIEAVLDVNDDPEDRQTLGGLCWHCYIDGDIVKVAGDDDGQGMMIVPITILMP